jgi:Uma2 family endonuclease
MVISAKTFEQVALDDGDARWELDRGVLRRKPDMSMEHNRASMELGFQIRAQITRSEYGVRVNAGHLAHARDSYYIPDVCVIPAALEARLKGSGGLLKSYAEPLPFVAEVWSPSTGAYDVDTKVALYRERGDTEIWLLHPYDRTVRAWLRGSDGAYAERRYAGGRVRLSAIPGVPIDLDAVFEPST